MSEKIKRLKRELKYKGAIVDFYQDTMEIDGTHTATWEVPAGALDAADEPGIVCAGRELEEETGFRSENLEWLITLRTTVAFCNERIEVFVARDLIPSRQHLDEDEFIDLKAYTLEELKEKIFSGEIEDSKTIAALLAYETKYRKTE